MSRIWPDPLRDKGDEFWDFDNMTTEYEYECERRGIDSYPKKRKSRKNRQPRNITVYLLVIVATFLGMIVCSGACPPLVIVLFVFLMFWLFRY